MGLLQQAVGTYDSMEHLAGVMVEGKEVLAPIGHIITTIKIEITVSGNGQFVRAVNNCDIKAAIPVSERSAGRTSTPCAHPLCDNLGYITEFDEEKHNFYINELDKWADSNYGSIKLNAIQKYIHQGTVAKDLIDSGIIELDSSGKMKNEKDMVGWRVEGIGRDSGAVYEDKQLMDNYYRFYMESVQAVLGCCMVTGEQEQLSIQHLKGVSNYSGNAKLISSNDATNFTYRGRFDNAAEALSIGYIASQKSHNALKWLLSNDGIALGDRRLICWNPKGKKLPQINLPLIKLDTNTKANPTEYKRKLNNVLLGYKDELEENESVVIAAFEAATSGRLSVTYYNEFLGSDFLDRLKYWDETCCWNNKYGVSSPPLYQIINCAFGIQRGDGENALLETDTKVIGAQMQRLIACRVDRSLFPLDIVRNIVQKASNLQIYSKSNREKLLFTACAVMKKYRNDYYKEELSMALEVSKKDRSYQYGRLLAILEKIEKDTYDVGEGRETNAIRSQAFFAQRPYVAFNQIMTALKTGYYPRLSIGAKNYYEKLIGEIMVIISDYGDEEIGKPLSESYLLGYYLQKNALYTKKESETNEEE